jgi:CHAD domain-containing protein
MQRESMPQYAHRQTSALLRRLASQVNRAAESGHPDAIHDLRVAVRRLSRCLRTFAPFYPKGSWKEIRHQLRGLMQMTGAVRDCDIAMECLEKAGVSQRAIIFRRLRADRRQANNAMLIEVRLWKSQAVSRKWRARLGV